MGYSKWLLLAFLVVLFNYASTGEVEKVLQNVPKKDLYDFVRYYSTIGYELSLDNNKATSGKKNKARSSELDSVSNFSVKLYKWLTEKSTLKSRRTRTYGRNVICFPNNQCVDVGDVGIHP